MITTVQVAKAAGISPRTKKFTLHDQDGIPYDGSRSDLVLAALSRNDKTNLPVEVHTVAYAIRKSMVTARMRPELATRIGGYTPYQVCALVARVTQAHPEPCIGLLADDWLNDHADEL